MPVGSGCDGSGSFPLLAGDDDDAGHSGPVVRAIAARVRVAGGSVPGEPDSAGGVQSAGTRGAGDIPETEFLARGKRGRGGARAWRKAGELDGVRVPAIIVANLRSAGAAVSAGRRADLE